MTNNILRFWQQAGDDPFEPLFEAAPIMMHSITREGVIVAASRFGQPSWDTTVKK